MAKSENLSLILRPPSAAEKAEPRARRILFDMVADTLALVKEDRLDSPGANAALVEKWLRLGKDCYFGHGVPKSYDKAFAFFSRAAAAGHPEAQFHVALCLEDGDGVKPDRVQAAEWYRKSAVGGFAKAQNNLSICYRDGHGVPQDYAEAEKWYCIAAEQGYAPTSCRPRNESRGHGLTCEQLISFQQPGQVQRMGFYYRYK
jgi:TPR repeat protein